MRQSRVMRGRPLRRAATSSRRSGPWTDRSVPLGKYWRSRPLVFSLEPRCQGLCGSQKYTGRSVAKVISAWRAISRPWSQVSERRSCSGRVRMALTIASLTATAPCPSGRCSSITNRVVRSTRVPIAEPLAVPVIRSPSQCPGTARSAASAGRSEISTMSGDLTALGGGPPPAGPAGRPAGAQAGVQLLAQRTAPLDEDGLVDRLVADAHGPIVGEVRAQAPGDLLRAPAQAQLGLDVGAQPGVAGELGRLGAPGPLVGLGLGQVRPVGMGVPGGPVTGQLPADRAGGTSQRACDLPHPLARGAPYRDLVPLLHAQTASRGLAED
nr:hypothetical protein DA06_06330 [Georgenia sp. SUBG003]